LCKEIYFLVLTNPSTYKPEDFSGFFVLQPDWFRKLLNTDLLISLKLHRYFIIYKPYLVLSQFSFGLSEPNGNNIKQTLKDFFNVPHNVYPVGRLDYDSEGLLILTNDTNLNHLLLNPSFAHEREYWVQVEGLINQTALNRLQSGVEIMIDGKPYLSRKARVESFEDDPIVPERNPSIRFRKNIPTSWIKMILTEGKNRQVRKMTARAGFPTLRLLRYRISLLTIDGLKPGSIKEIDRNEIYRLLF
jgi:23S rRNA pseudouridine2457 synthase